MSISLYYRAVGYRILCADADYAASFLELCRRESYAYGEFRHLPEGGIALCFTLTTAKAALAHAAALDIPLRMERTGGLPRILSRLFRRPGLVVGCMLGLILLGAASRVVWDIRISGNSRVSDRAIEESLAACGFTVGSPLRGFRADVTENHVLMADPRLSWISINRRGTVAYVEVRESAHAPDEDATGAADIVAATGGIIERVELIAGNIRVTAGQTVSPGDVLVSGLYDSSLPGGQSGIRYTRAEARVYARTVHEMTVSIPLSYERKVYEGGPDRTLEGVCQEKSVIFFGKSIKFSKKTGNGGGVCDTIESERSLGLIDRVGFPLSVRTVWYLPYTVQPATRTYDEAEELAYVELARRIGALPGGAELLQKTVTVHRTPDALILHCVLHCIEDIGTVREIEMG